MLIKSQEALWWRWHLTIILTAKSMYGTSKNVIFWTEFWMKFVLFSFEYRPRNRSSLNYFYWEQTYNYWITLHLVWWIHLLFLNSGTYSCCAVSIIDILRSWKKKWWESREFESLVKIMGCSVASFTFDSIPWSIIQRCVTRSTL